MSRRADSSDLREIMLSVVSYGHSTLYAYGRRTAHGSHGYEDQ